jgi:Carbohydrate family 9 binding domain-like
MRVSLSACVMAILAPAMASAQQSPTTVADTPAATSAPRDFDNYTPRITAVRIERQDAPVIDGDLSDPAWRNAAVIEEFYQIDPVEGVTPSQPTRAYIMYDSKNLYVAVYAYDTEPDRIRRSQLQRDPALQDDDGIRVLIDSFGSFRDSYFFGVNPNGARSDALTENNGAFNDRWNTIWRAKAKVVEDGWIAEFAIPFQSISFDPALDEWNLQIIRTIRRDNEEIRWSNIDQSRNRIDMTNPGRVSGISDIDNGIGLEVQAFATGVASRDWVLGETDVELTPSGNIFYKITPSLTGSLTFNTDFSNTALDTRQVNTGRFSLFFPETRDFFLQDAAVFEFGGNIFRRGPSNGLPFFSRNIGIVGGRPVDLIAGAKLSGKIGPANVGVISTRTGAADASNIDGQYLSSARISVPVLSESKIGFVLTNGDPSGETNNTVAGVDFQYKKSNLFGKGTLTADFAHIRSYDEGVNDAMTAAHISYRSQTWNTRLRLRDIGEDYAPKLGFINRPGIKRLDGRVFRAYRPNTKLLRYAETGAFGNLVTDQSGQRQDELLGGWVFLQNNPGDSVNVEYQHRVERINQPFNIAGEVPVNPGDYQWNRYGVNLSTSRSRMLGIGADVRWGGVYDGDLLELRTNMDFRPSKHFQLSTSYNLLQFKLPTGDVSVHIASINSTIAFTPDMSIKTEVQYDNISQSFTYFSRFTWEPVPEREIFLSFGHTALINRENFPRDFTSLGSSLALRLGHKFRL